MFIFHTIVSSLPLSVRTPHSLIITARYIHREPLAKLFPFVSDTGAQIYLSILCVDSVGSGDIRGSDECKELLEREQWLAL
jgi:hypothetical protein